MTDTIAPASQKRTIEQNCPVLSGCNGIMFVLIGKVLILCTSMPRTLFVDRASPLGCKFIY